MISKMIAAIALLGLSGWLFMGCILSLINIWWATLIPVLMGIGTFIIPKDDHESMDSGYRWRE